MASFIEQMLQTTEPAYSRGLEPLPYLAPEPLPVPARDLLKVWALVRVAFTGQPTAQTATAQERSVEHNEKIPAQQGGPSGGCVLTQTFRKIKTLAHDLSARRSVSQRQSSTYSQLSSRIDGNIKQRKASRQEGAGCAILLNTLDWPEPSSQVMRNLAGK